MPLRSVPLLTLILLLVVLLTGCLGLREPQAPSLASRTALPSEELILLAAETHGASSGSELLLLDPATGTVSRWQLQGGRGLSEGDRICRSHSDQQRWDTERREFVFSGSLGCASGLYRIAADGAVIQEQSPALPEGRIPLEPQISAPSGDQVAVVGSIVGPDGRATTQQIYVAGPDGEWAIYGEELGLEQINYLRWSPDSSAISFIGGFHSGSPFHRHLYHLDVKTGELQALSQEETDGIPLFTPDGEVVFIAGNARGGSRALYRASPGSPAELLFEFGPRLPASPWQRHPVLSPDGRLLAFSGMRDDAIAATTVYVFNLDTGELRDLLPPDVADMRTGARPDEPPSSHPIVWSPDSQRLLVASDRSGICSTPHKASEVSCTEQLYAVPLHGGAPARLGEIEFAEISFALWVE